MSKETVSIEFTKEELWTLANNFDQAFASGHPDNALEDEMSGKLWEAYHTFDDPKPSEKV